MGFIIDGIFGIVDAVDDLKLNIQDKWYEAKINHYINKYHDETGKYPENNFIKQEPKLVERQPVQPFMIPDSVVKSCVDEIKRMKAESNNDEPDNIIEIVEKDDGSEEVIVEVNTKKEIDLKEKDVNTETTIKPPETKNNKNVTTNSKTSTKSKNRTNRNKSTATESTENKNKPYAALLKGLEGKTQSKESAKLVVESISEIDKLMSEKLNDVLHTN